MLRYQTNQGSEPAVNNMKDRQRYGPPKNIPLDDEELDETTSMEAESFLESYEEMLRHQTEEMGATLRHLEPLLELLESKSDHRSTNRASPFAKEFTYRSLKEALQEIEEDDSLHFVASDLQWKLVLQLLTENEVSAEDCISWAEIVMCYRTCIIGMQTLDQTPEQNPIRTRIRQRSLHMLYSFRPGGSDSTVPSAKASQKSAFQWVDSLFIFGSLVLLGAIAMSHFGLLVKVGSGVTSASFDTYFQAPLILGPHVAPFSTENTIIPGPHVMPYVEAFLIPGPLVPPFYVAEDAAPSTLISSERSHPATLSPVSVRKDVEKRTRPNTLPRMGGPLQSRRRKRSQAKVQGEPDTSSQADLLRQTTPSQKDGNKLNRHAVIVAAVAGGTAAGALAPVFSTMASSLGATLPGLLPIGATVVVSTLLAHGIRDWVASLARKRRTSRGD